MMPGRSDDFRQTVRVMGGGKVSLAGGWRGDGVPPRRLVQLLGEHVGALLDGPDEDLGEAGGPEELILSIAQRLQLQGHSASEMNRGAKRQKTFPALTESGAATP